MNANRKSLLWLVALLCSAMTAHCTDSGPRISGQSAITRSGVQMLAGVASVSRSNSGNAGGSSQQEQPAGLEGEYNGTVSSSDTRQPSVVDPVHSQR